MALVRVGGGITAIKGSIGGTTFSRGKMGVTAKRRPSAVNKDTYFQGVARGNMSEISKLWQSALDETERAEWNAFALSNPSVNAFGDTVYLSGAMWYSKLNAVLRRLGSTLLTSPPPSIVVSSLTDVILSASAGTSPTITVEPTPSSLGTNEEVYIWISYPASAGRFFVSSALRLITTGTGATIDISADVVAKFGTWPTSAGLKVFSWCAVVNTETGVVSPGIISSAILT